ncbi:MAG TPA: excinuclease ABC subunit UvrC [Nitrosopumilaceae archaeon]|nr:excinuclease ABC subunit UvrC [Nitrosopumilaceae archaeon]
MTFDISSVIIPSHPGIYMMKDENGRIIYIGKAKNLKKRVKSYFLQNQNYKTQKLVEKISDIEFVLTDNEGEAYILESNMIKKYRPIYNIELKDQQRYTYLRLTEEKYPRLLVARRMRTGKFLGSGKVFGPFTSGSSKLLTIGTLRKTFKIRICKTLPKKACLEYHLGNCEAPCEFIEAQKKYSKNVNELELILKGKKQMQEFAEKLQNDMKQASESLNYERAKEIRDTLNRLGSLQTKQKMEYVENAPDEDYIGIKIEEQTALIMSLRQTHGIIRDSNRFSFDLIGDNTFGNFLYQYYTTRPIPKKIIVNDVPENKKILENALSKIAGFEVNIIVPKKGKRKEMIGLVMKNINLIQSKGIDPGIYEIKEYLELENFPKIIECFDVSNHGTQYSVGSMSRIVNGQPDKSGYRKFRIKTVSGRNDYAMIDEIVKRRYFRLSEENLELPNLILIDGGKGHLRAAEKALQSLSVKVECASLAKQNEEVFVSKSKNPIIIPRSSSGLKILQYARDEAHRFGVAYNRALRKLN